MLSDAILANMSQPIQVPEPVLVDLLGRAASAARRVGNLYDNRGDGGALDQLADDIDAIAHELTELLGASRVQTARHSTEAVVRDDGGACTTGPRRLGATSGGDK